MLSRGLVLLFLALVALGCGARSAGRAARGPDQRAMVRLERQAQQDMSCETPLHVLALEPRAYQVDGCGQLREYAWVCPSRRCVFQPIVPAVIRASGDLQCAPDQLAVSADAPLHRAFFGCTRGAAYSLMCLDRGCTWSRTQEAVTMGGPGMVAPPPAALVADPTLDAVAVPPPPGAPSAFDPPTSAEPAVPPPPGAPPPPAPPPASTADSVVIPPPPS